MVRMHFAENPEEKKKHGDEPEEPRPQDCCGLSCNPCIFDLHHQDVMLWAKECARCIKLENGMTLFEEVIGVEENVDNLEEIFSKDEYRQFEIVAITKMAPNTNMYKFKTAKSKDLPLGCHLIARPVTNNANTYIP
ncbi:unnamed protein product, partial [Mesorhabditis belari]|uniref:Oxidoreductase-like domain-containing protein n=1 Tax=Mesorhabditis belari TaxID=2138241 RepID=A0AAF3EET5_9BILA